MKRNIIEILILLLVASFVIFFQFNQIPKKLSWDEVEFARLALSLDGKPYAPYSELATGHSTLYFYILLVSIKIFGLTNFGLRFPAALFGVVNVLIFYLIGKLVFSKLKYFKTNLFPASLPAPASILPLLISIVLASSRWYFNFARFSFEATFLLFLELSAIYFFLKFLSNDNQQLTINLFLSSLFSGLAFLSYYPGRIFFLLPLAFLFVHSSKRNVLFFVVTLLLTTFPLTTYLATHKDLRIQEQLFLTDKKLTIQNKVSYFSFNSTKIMYMFTHYGDLNGRHNYPGKSLFNPLVGAFFLFGFLVTLVNWKNFYNQFFFFYFLLSLLPALFTYPVENPNSLRTYTAIVPSIYFMGNGILYLLQSDQSKKLILFVIIMIIFLFSLSSLYDLRTYFLYQKVVFNQAFELNGSIQRIINLKLWEKTGFF